MKTLINCKLNTFFNVKFEKLKKEEKKKKRKKYIYTMFYMFYLGKQEETLPDTVIKLLVFCLEN